jgi:hypothetical protein
VVTEWSEPHTQARVAAEAEAAEARAARRAAEGEKSAARRSALALAEQKETAARAQVRPSAGARVSSV